MSADIRNNVIGAEQQIAQLENDLHAIEEGQHQGFADASRARRIEDQIDELEEIASHNEQRGVPGEG